MATPRPRRSFGRPDGAGRPRPAAGGDRYERRGGPGGGDRNERRGGPGGGDRFDAAADLEVASALNAVVVLAVEIVMSVVVGLVAASGLNAMAPRGNVGIALIPRAAQVAVLIVLAATTVLIAVVALIAPTAADVQLPDMAAPSPISIANRKPRA